MTTTPPNGSTSSWLAVARSRDVASKPRRIVLDGRPLVLFRSGTNVRCLLDRCPHRFAPLSGGRVIDGEIECPYHGWRFDGGGHCRSMPGLISPLPRVAVPTYPVREQNGLIFIAPGDGAGSPYAGVMTGPQAVSRIVESRVRSTVVEVAENILDATHTHFTHRLLLRGMSSKRHAVTVTVTGGDGWVEARYVGEPRQHGLVSRMLEGERSVSVGRFLAPGIAELEFWGRDRINLATTFHLRQENEETVHGFGVLAGPRLGGLGHVKGMLFEPLFKIALWQDQKILETARTNAGAANPKPLVAPLDILRPHIEAIMRGVPPSIAGGRSEMTMEL